MTVTADDSREWLRERELWGGLRRYDDATKGWLRRSGHYLDNPPPGALFAVGLERLGAGLFGAVPDGALVGLIVVGRPVAPALPQDGTWADMQRICLEPGLPHGTCSRLIRIAAEYAERRGVRVLIAYHDRTRHSGCIYRKAGMRKDGGHDGRSSGWGSRDRPRSEAVGVAPKRRWRIDLGQQV